MDWETAKETALRWLRKLLSVGRSIGTALLVAFLIQVGALMMSEGYGMDEEPLVRLTFLGTFAALFLGIEIGRRIYGPKPPKQ